MLLKKIDCKKCGYSYDGHIEECPKCHEKNDTFLSLFPNNKMTWVDLWRQLGIFVLGWIGFNIIGTIYVFISYIYALSIFPNDLTAAQNFISSSQNLMLNSTISYVLLLCGMIAITFPYLKKIFSGYKNPTNILFGLLLGFALIGASTAYGIFVASFFKTTGNANETILESLIGDYPVLAILIFGIVGPICEEFAYRVGLFNVLYRTKRWVAYIVTVLVFAFIHFDITALWNVITSYSQTNLDVFINEIVNLPQYMIAGLILCFAYERYGFAGSSIAHVLNNLITITSVIISINLR
ncbi:MAG: CPBP family glutamic-type intramembrane protease [Erysipelotrichaceae bacterium]|nr:CPBP family glutamic-type intramembrane protease [Erysipelotrichaceae bacterium]